MAVLENLGLYSESQNHRAEAVILPFERPNPTAKKASLDCTQNAIELFRKKLSPIYLNDRRQSGHELFFTVQKVGLYDTSNMPPKSGTNIYTMNSEDSSSYGSAVYDNFGLSLGSDTLSRSPNRASDLAVVATAMREIRVNLGQLVQEYAVDPFVLLSALPNRSSAPAHL